MSEQTSLIPTALVPSGVKDDRQHALAQLFGEALAKIDLSKLVTTDPLTVDARLLPFMIREFGAQDFIAPDLPEHVQRRILASIWELKSLHGYDAGVRLGLSLLGMRMVIRHWHQENPVGPPNTQTVDVFSPGRIFWDSDDILSPREIAAVQQMIEATKRASQETQLRMGFGHRSTISAATKHVAKSIERRTARPSPAADTHHTTLSARTAHIARFVSRQIHRPILPEAVANV